MPEFKAFVESVTNGAFDMKFIKLYASDTEGAKARVLRLCERFEENFGGYGDVSLFSAPGRTEIGGNHTDHNHGKVLAGAVNLDILALCRKNSDNVIRVYSEGFKKDNVSLADLRPNDNEYGAEKLIRGIAAGIVENGGIVGGMDCITHSHVLPGSGLSSSAAFENAIGLALNRFYGGSLTPLTLARIGQYAENNYLHKPSGLLDQTASALGGLTAIDFKNPFEPVIHTPRFNLQGYDLIVTGPIGSHADLTEDYAAVPGEMKAIAQKLGADTLREADEAGFYARIPELRKSVSDRAVLRAIHFFEENKRVDKQTAALEADDLAAFFHEIKASGRSSYMYLQNVITRDDQGLGIALALSGQVLAGRGAYRVHGGGFAGTIQAFVPHDLTACYIKTLEAAMGCECMRLSIREQGAVQIA